MRAGHDLLALVSGIVLATLLAGCPGSKSEVRHRVLVIGDSSTAGAVSGGFGIPYPTLLALQLGRRFEVVNLGCSGGNTEKWDPSAPDRTCWGAAGLSFPVFDTYVGSNLPADVATIMLGTIDSGFPNLTVEPAAYRLHLTAIIAELEVRGVEHVVLMTAPRRAEPDPDIQARLVAYRDLIVDPVDGICATTTAFCGPDLHEDLHRELYFHEVDTHPNGAGHAAIAEWLAAAIRAAIPPSACDNGQDDDGDGLVDHGEDPGCLTAFDESEEPDCSDGLDQDGDGAADHPEDGGCTAADDTDERDPQWPCDDGVDGDGDGRTDFPADLGCAHPADPSERDPQWPCDDGWDDDGDGLVDYPADPGCRDPEDSSEEIDCYNGLDDDGDGKVDEGDDPWCSGPADPSELPACRDGLDNDGDGSVDFPNDRTCRDPDWGAEISECSDGLDNDDDGGIDTFLTPSEFNDSNCIFQPWKNTETAKKRCGLGAELALSALLVIRLRRGRRAQRSSDTSTSR